MWGILAVGRLRQEDLEKFKGSPEYTVNNTRPV